MIRLRLLITALLGAALLAAPTASAAIPQDGLGLTAFVSDSRAAVSGTAAYQSVTVAQAAGYAEFRDAAGIACIDNPPLGAMGIHYVKGAFVGDTVLDPAKPEAVVYEPTDRGLRLVALEYIVFKAPWDATHLSRPSLFGHEFGLVNSPNRYGLPPFYELHAWIWKLNPSGLFFEWNPLVSCAAA
jgi:hypothetical protein